MNNPQNLSALVWNTADEILRNIFRPSEYGRIILPFAVLRRLDCVLYKKKNQAIEIFKIYKNKIKNIDLLIKNELKLPFYNISKYDLLNIKSDPNNSLINFKNYINGFSDNVKNILDNFQLDPIIKKLNDNNKLYQIIDKFTEFDFHPAKIDNHLMGSIYEDLLRKFSEISNEESGDHYTPRDVVKLLVSLLMLNDQKLKKEKGIIKSIYDPCCGTGGMLTYGKNLIKKQNSTIEVQLFGQELNDLTYAICKSDFLMLNEDPDNISGPFSTLTKDFFKERKFDYILANPPFGKNWKTEREKIELESKEPNGRFSNGLPWIKDGQLLFLSHMISKLNPNGGKIGVITNGAALTTGFGLRGESEFRKYILDNDFLESIVCLPDDLFFNTGILCYILILNNKKEEKYKNKIRIFDFIDFYEEMFKPIGDKRKLISDNLIEKILKIYNSEVHERVKIFNKDQFYYKLIQLHKKVLDSKLNPIRDKKGNFKKDKNKTILYKVSIDVNEESVLQKLTNNDNFFFLPEETVIGCEYHITKYIYKNKKSPNYNNSKESFFESLKNLNSFKEKKLSNLKFKEIEDSIYWFGKIKKNWKIGKIGDYFEERNTKVSELNYQPLSITKNGIVSQLEHVVKTSDKGNRKLVEKYDFVINSRSDRKGSSGISPMEGSVTNIAIVLSYSKKIFRPGYINFLFRTIEFQEEFYKYGKGIVDDLWTTDYQDMKEILIPIPDLIEQDNIISQLKEVILYELSLKDTIKTYENYKNSLISRLMFLGNHEN